MGVEPHRSAMKIDLLPFGTLEIKCTISHIESKKANRGPIGRPTKFTPETRELIIAAIRTGNYIETAAAVAGISKETFYAWMHKGEAEDAPEEFSAFSDAIKRPMRRLGYGKWR